VGLAVQAIRQALALTFKDTYADVIAGLMGDIGDPGGGEGIVPCATGQLRENLLMNLGSSRQWDTGMQVTVGANVTSITGFNYPAKVNNMPASSLRHYGKQVYVNYGGNAYKKDGGTPITLNDPGAQHNWMQFLLLHAKAGMKAYYKFYLRQHSASLGLTIAQNVARVEVFK
jgi:hypothetical protein